MTGEWIDVDMLKLAPSQFLKNKLSLTLSIGPLFALLHWCSQRRLGTTRARVHPHTRTHTHAPTYIIHTHTRTYMYTYARTYTIININRVYLHDRGDQHHPFRQRCRHGHSKAKQVEAASVNMVQEETKNQHECMWFACKYYCEWWNLKIVKEWYSCNIEY